MGSSPCYKLVIRNRINLLGHVGVGVCALSFSSNYLLCFLTIFCFYFWVRVQKNRKQKEINKGLFYHLAKLMKEDEGDENAFIRRQSILPESRCRKMRFK
jgi:hypothetical protein